MPALEAPRRAVAVRHPPQLLPVAGEQVEAAVVRRTCRHVGHIGCRRWCTSEKTAHERAARFRSGRLARAAIVGHGGETAAAADAHPRAHRLQVAPGKNRRPVAPESGGSGGPGMKLVAVRSNEERIARVCPPPQDDQAHTKRSVRRCTPSFAPSRSRSRSKAASSFTPSYTSI